MGKFLSKHRLHVSIIHIRSNLVCFRLSFCLGYYRALHSVCWSDETPLRFSSLMISLILRTEKDFSGLSALKFLVASSGCQLLCVSLIVAVMTAGCL